MKLTFWVSLVFNKKSKKTFLLNTCWNTNNGTLAKKHHELNCATGMLFP